MNYINHAFPRMSLYQIRSFILHGSDDLGDGLHPYGDTLKRETQPIYNRLESIYPFGAERDAAAGDLSQALAAYEAVYMELGMKAGARLIWQLMASDDQPLTERG